jgi:hypothetical protein
MSKCVIKTRCFTISNAHACASASFTFRFHNIFLTCGTCFIPFSILNFGGIFTRDFLLLRILYKIVLTCSPSYRNGNINDGICPKMLKFLFVVAYYYYELYFRVLCFQALKIISFLKLRDRVLKYIIILLV